MFTEDTSLRLPAYDALLFRSEKYIIVALTMAGVPAHTGCLSVQNILDECNRIVCEALQIRIGESERHQPLNDDVKGAIIVSVRAGTALPKFAFSSFLTSRISEGRENAALSQKRILSVPEAAS